MRSLFAAVPEAEAATDEAKQAGAEAPRSPTRRQREKRRSAPRTLQEEADAYHEMAQQANLLQSRQLRFAAARRLAAERTGVGAGEQLPVALGVVRELEDRLRALEGAIEGAGAAAGSPAAVAGGGGHTSRAIARLVESHERWRSEDEVLQRELDSVCTCQAQVAALLARALERPAALATSGGAAPAAAAASAVAALPALVQSCIDSLSGSGADTADDAWFREESAFLQGVAPLVSADLLPSSSCTGMAMSSEAAAAILHQEEEADDSGLGKLLVKLEIMGQRFIVEEEGRQMVFDWASPTGRGPGSSSSLLAGGLEGAGTGSEGLSQRRRGQAGRTLLSGGLSEEPPGAEGSISPKRTKRRPKDGAGPKSPRRERRPGALDLTAPGALVSSEGGALPEPPSLLEDAAVTSAFDSLDAQDAAGSRSALAQLELQSRCLQEDVAGLRRRLRALAAAARAPPEGAGAGSSPRWLLACPRPPPEGAAGASAAVRQVALPPTAALRAELADAWALLAERGERRREAEALRRDCRRAEEELAALRGRAPAPRRGEAAAAPGDDRPLSGSPTYARLHDGRQVELTSKVQQQAAELEELRRRLNAIRADG